MYVLTMVINNKRLYVEKYHRYGSYKNSRIMIKLTENLENARKWDRYPIIILNKAFKSGYEKI